MGKFKAEVEIETDGEWCGRHCPLKIEMEYRNSCVLQESILVDWDSEHYEFKRCPACLAAERKQAWRPVPDIVGHEWWWRNNLGTCPCISVVWKGSRPWAWVHNIFGPIERKLGVLWSPAYAPEGGDD